MDWYLWNRNILILVSICLITACGGGGSTATEEIDNSNTPLAPVNTYKPTATPTPDVPHPIFSTIKPTPILPILTPSPTNNPIPHPTFIPPISHDYDLSEGRDLYLKKCASCHGSTGNGGPGGSLKLGSCLTCSNLNSLTNFISTNMPSPGACIGTCSLSTAAYIFNNFKVAAATPNPTTTPIATPTVSPMFPPEPTTVPTAAPHSTLSPVPIVTPRPTNSATNGIYKLSDIGVLTARETLRKATLVLFGRSPTSEELDPIIARGEAGLDDALSIVVEDKNLALKIGEIYNDEFNWNARPEVRDAIITRDYLGEDWWGTDNKKRNLAWAAIRNSGRALVEHTVENNLPISNIVTANYMMVNPYSARTLNVYNRLAFSGVDNENDWRKVVLTERFLKVDSRCVTSTSTACVKEWFPFPNTGTADGTFGHVGLLTDIFLLESIPFTPTNLNRARARYFYKTFLDFDVMTLDGERTVSDSDPEIQNPTLNNSNCSICHSYVDPIAATFLERRNTSTYNPNLSLTDINLFPAGYKKSLNNIEYYGDNESEKTENPLRWLARQIINDPRFSRAQVNIIYRGLIGKDILRQGANEEALDSQEHLLNSINLKFKSNNLNLKYVVKDIIKSKYFRANRILDENNISAHLNTGTVRLIGLDTLNEKLKNMLGSEWVVFNNPIYTNHLSSLYDLYNTPSTSENGIASAISASNVAIHQKLALDMSCYIVPRDFFFSNTNDRLLFKKVNRTQTPFNMDGTENTISKKAIMDNIIFLHEYLLGEKLTASDYEIQTTYNLWVDTWRAGQELIKISANVPLTCPVTYHPVTNAVLPTEERILTDISYVMRSWTMVLSYLLSDYKFYYE
ncbi:MAG: c-type cytochrome [Pseudomonadota bacterium]